MKNLNKFFKNILSFQKENEQDFFLGAETKYYEIFAKHGEDLRILKDRILFYNLNTTAILKNEDQRKWFELWINSILDLLEKNKYSLDEKRADEKLNNSAEKTRKVKFF